jgi:hypothetical protein
MRRRSAVRWAAGAAAIGCVAVVVVPSQAFASSTDYLSPTGSGTACTQAAPCTLAYWEASVESTLFAGSVTILEGDGGTYGTIGSPLTSQINVPSAVTLEGDPAQARPVIHSNVSGNAGIDTLSTTAVVSDVDIEYTGNESAIDGPGTFNRVIANVPSGAAAACTFLNGATLTDSICSGEYGLYDAVGGSSVPWDFTLRNDTIYGSTTAVTLNAGGPLLAVTISNSIIRSAAGADLIVEESSGSAAATLDHSNYGSVQLGGSATATAAGSATNQTAAPSFVDVATNNFHEVAGSPTIDVGSDSSANGTLDLDGNTRDVGAHTDIGAYEFLIAPSASTAAATAVTETGVALNGAVDPEGLATTYQFQYGTSTSYGSVTPSSSAGAANSAASVSAPLSGLSPGTTYHYRLAATNSQGTTYGTDETFTTVTDPVIGKSLPSAEVDHPYSEPIVVSGGALPQTFSLVAGTLPAGLTLSSSGTISGTPRATAAASLTVKDTDADGVSVTGVVSLNVLAPTIKIDSSKLKFKHSNTSIELTCETAACSGKAEITKTERVKVKKDHKTKTKTETIVLASGSYSLATGATGEVTITLTGPGKHDLAHVASHALHETAKATVLGGTTATTKVKVS